LLFQARRNRLRFLSPQQPWQIQPQQTRSADPQSITAKQLGTMIRNRPVLHRSEAFQKLLQFRVCVVIIIRT
jgi:hypothetical protein